MNPYASYLGNRNPREVISATPGALETLLKKLGAGGAERAPAAGKWSAREILCHLADTEVVFAFRLRQTMAEPHHVIQPMDQDEWAARYSAFSVRAALEVFRAVRAWNVMLIESLPHEALSRPVTHPERGEMTFQTLVETMGGHDLNHLGQLERIASLFAAS